MNVINYVDLYLEYEEFLSKTSWYVGANQEDLLELNYLMLGLGGESGETVDEFKKIIRERAMCVPISSIGKADPKKLLKVLEELGDVFWYYTRILDVLKINPSDIMIMNTVKLYERYRDNPDKYPHQLGEIKWPLTSIAYESALKWTQRIESRITGPSASTSTDTDT